MGVSLNFEENEKGGSVVTENPKGGSLKTLEGFREGHGGDCKSHIKLLWRITSVK